MSHRLQEWFKLNAGSFSGQLLFDEPLSRHTYYRIGGPAAVLAFPKSIEDLRCLVEGISQTQAKVFVLGQGSNLLVSDQGYSGVVVRASRLNLEMTLLESSLGDSDLRVRTGSGVLVSSLLRKACQEGWGGLEFLTGVPGSVGGCVWMNAGTHLGVTENQLVRVVCYSLKGPNALSFAPLVYEGSDLQFEYRKNLFLPETGLIWSAEWKIEKKEPAAVKSVVDENLARRKATQPIDFPSCGSVFKNPKAHGLHAWQVIEKLGLRGHRIGNAQFSEKHSNFIINLGGAQASDVKALIALAKSRALADLGIPLEEEVIYLD